MSEGEPIVAVALLSQRDIDRFGDNLMRCYRVDDASDFDELLRLIDQADSARENRIEGGTA